LGWLRPPAIDEDDDKSWWQYDIFFVVVVFVNCQEFEKMTSMTSKCLLKSLFAFERGDVYSSHQYWSYCTIL
jgi:hypothetical protein